MQASAQPWAASLDKGSCYDAQQRRLFFSLLSAQPRLFALGLPDSSIVACNVNAEGCTCRLLMHDLMSSCSFLSNHCKEGVRELQGALKVSHDMLRCADAFGMMHCSHLQSTHWMGM